MLISILLTLALVPAVDILPAGHKAVVNEVVVLGEVEGMQLVAGPLPGFGSTVVTPGEPFRISGKYGTHLYAVPAYEELPTGHDRDWYERQIPASTFPQDISSVSLASPLTRIRWTFRVLGIEGGELQLELVDEERFGASGAPYDGRSYFGVLLAISACGLAGLGLLARRRLKR